MYSVFDSCFFSAQGVTLQPGDKKNNPDSINDFVEIAPLPLLNSDASFGGYGVIAKAAICKGMVLGSYEGEKIRNVQFDIHADSDACSISESEIDTTYFFMLTQYTTIDAKKKGNWTRFINHATNGLTNVSFSIRDKHIVFVANKPIYQGQQLLIDYGDKYVFKTEQKFLRPSDNHNESKDIVKKNKLAYEKNIQAYIPIIEKLTSANVDIPLLIIEGGTLLPQHQQDNMTSLMHACYYGEKDNIQKLLGLGANPFIQSSIYGLSPLHFLIASTASDMNESKKISVLDFFLKQIKSHIDTKEIFCLQDKQGRSILDYAINQNSLPLVEFLLKTCNSLLQLINNKDQDSFIYALSLKRTEIAMYLMNQLTKSDLISYEKNEAFSTIIKDAEDVIKQSLIEHCVQIKFETPPYLTDYLQKQSAPVCVSSDFSQPKSRRYVLSRFSNQANDMPSELGKRKAASSSFKKRLKSSMPAQKNTIGFLRNSPPFWEVHQKEIEKLGQDFTLKRLGLFELQQLMENIHLKKTCGNMVEHFIHCESRISPSVHNLDYQFYMLFLHAVICVQHLIESDAIKLQVLSKLNNALIKLKKFDVITDLAVFSNDISAISCEDNAKPSRSSTDRFFRRGEEDRMLVESVENRTTASHGNVLN